MDGGTKIHDIAAGDHGADIVWRHAGDGTLSTWLWRQDGGMMSNWLARPAGNFTSNDANAAAFVEPEWRAGIQDVWAL